VLWSPVHVISSARDSPINTSERVQSLFLTVREPRPSPYLCGSLSPSSKEWGSQGPLLTCAGVQSLFLPMRESSSTSNHRQSPVTVLDSARVQSLLSEVKKSYHWGSPVQLHNRAGVLSLLFLPMLESIASPYQSWCFLSLFFSVRWFSPGSYQCGSPVPLCLRRVHSGRIDHLGPRMASKKVKIFLWSFNGYLTLCILVLHFVWPFWRSRSSQSWKSYGVTYCNCV